MNSADPPILVSLFQEAGNIPIEKSPGYRTTHLPVHPSESGESLHINAYGYWKCWSCEAHGGLVQAVMSLNRFDREKLAEAWLRDRYPLSVQRLAEDKGLPCALLSSLGVRDLDDGVIGIPYKDLQGKEVATKRRDTYTARLGSSWPKGTPLMPYGLEHLQRARQLGYLALVEGESDTWTLLHYHFPALGIPGATQWGTLKASYLEGIATLYVWQEPGAGGQTFVRGIEKRLADLGWEGQAKILHHKAAKDPNILHRWNPDAFPREFETLRKEAQLIEPGNMWRRAKSAPAFLAEPDPVFEGLAKDLLAPGSITLLASPRGLGKSVMSQALAVAIATGGLFRGERVRPVRVLLVDRDNPEPVIKERLRAWGADVAHNLHILTRADAPSLADRATWAAFPVEDYEVLIIDAVGSSTEGITEKEGKETTEVLATILDLTHRGLSVLLLQNVTKDGLVIRGRGEWMDRADIVYEIRDATGFIPSLTRDWWTELPDASEGAWAARAARRKGRCDFRLAFVVSKFRLGPWPEPFCLELHVPKGDRWALADVTETLRKEGEDAQAEAEQAQQERRDAAAEELLRLVQKYEQAGTPLLKTQAEAFLCEDAALKRKEARQVIKEKTDILWTILPAPSGRGKGKSQVLWSLGKTPPSESSANGEEEKASPAADLSGNTSDDGKQTHVWEPASDNGQRGTLSAVLAGSGWQTNPPASPCDTAVSESEFVCREETPSPIDAGILAPDAPPLDEDEETPSSETPYGKTSHGGEQLAALEVADTNGSKPVFSAALDASGRRDIPPDSPCVEGLAGDTIVCREHVPSPNGAEIPADETPTVVHSDPREKISEVTVKNANESNLVSGTLALEFYEPTLESVEAPPQTAVAIDVGTSFEPPSVLYVKDASNFGRVLPDLLSAPTVGLDTETTGLDPLVDKLRTVQIATQEHTVVVDTFQCPVQMLAPLMEGNRWLIGHNLKFDLKFLVQAGLPWPSASCFDTMLGAQVLGASTKPAAKGTYSLEGLVEHFLDVRLDKSWQRSGWEGTLSPAQVRYAAVDAAILLPLAKTIRQALQQARLWKVAVLEGACCRAIAWIELAGMPVDRDQWRAQAATYAQRKRELAMELSALAGRDINWNSKPQILSVLNARGLPVTATNRQVLLPHIADEVVAKLFEYRVIATRAQTYGEEWLKYVHPTSGRVHADYGQLGSTAGRMSCDHPNLQNIPRDPAYRRLFRAAEGFTLVKADYSQIELRLAAVIAPDDAMLHAYRVDEDIHIQTAAGILDLAPNDVAPEQRQLAKAVNFGLLYGMGAAKLQATAWEDYWVRLSEAEASQHRVRWLNLYPGIQQWHNQVGQRVNHRHAIETRTLYGRRRLGVDCFTDALNTPVQGSGADGLKLALVQLFEHQAGMPYARLVNVVHDEVLAECPAEQADATATWLKTYMEAAMQEVVKGQVPTPVDVQIGQSWAG